MQDFTIHEWTFIWFKYPNLMLLKGNIELVVYSFMNDTFYYDRLNCPIIKSNECDTSLAESLDVLYDCGDFYQLATIEVEYSDTIKLLIRYNRRLLHKSELP